MKYPRMGQIFHRVEMPLPFIWTIYCFHKELNHGVNHLLSADKGNRSSLLCHLLVIHNLLALSGSWTGHHTLLNPMRIALGKSIMFQVYFCTFLEERTCSFLYPADPQLEDTIMKVNIPAGASAKGCLQLEFISFPIKSTSFFKCFDIY